MSRTIQSTTDYTTFKTLGSNRRLSKPHVKRLVATFEGNPRSNAYNPILVNEDFEIIDGQHRVAALSELKLPVYYIIGSGLTIEDAQAINAGAKPWSPMDYARSFSDQGKSAYTLSRSAQRVSARGSLSSIRFRYSNSMGKILNYTTKIDPDKTAAEIAKLLSMNGAQAVLTEYDKDSGIVRAISFSIAVNENKIGFRLPCEWEPIYNILAKDRKFPYDTKRKEKMQSDLRLQAVRTAWRIVKDWVEAQMALIQTQMATTTEVFLPYAVMKDGRTLAQKIQTDPGFLLGDGT